MLTTSNELQRLAALAASVTFTAAVLELTAPGWGKLFLTAALLGFGVGLFTGLRATLNNTGVDLGLTVAVGTIEFAAVPTYKNEEAVEAAGVGSHMPSAGSETVMVGPGEGVGMGGPGTGGMGMGGSGSEIVRRPAANKGGGTGFNGFGPMPMPGGGLNGTMRGRRFTAFVQGIIFEGGEGGFAPEPVDHGPDHDGTGAGAEFVFEFTDAEVSTVVDAVSNVDIQVPAGLLTQGNEDGGDTGSNAFASAEAGDEFGEGDDGGANGGAGGGEGGGDEVGVGEGPTVRTRR